jgi:hypothetical protein
LINKNIVALDFWNGNDRKSNITFGVIDEDKIYGKSKVFLYSQEQDLQNGWEIKFDKIYSMNNLVREWSISGLIDT